MDNPERLKDWQWRSQLPFVEGRKATFQVELRWSLVARFTIMGQLRNRQVIATGRRIRELARLQAEYGRGNWRKYKGQATVQYTDGRMREAEVHWYEAHGIGRQELKIKKHLD
jgi:hypothetical protein